MRLALFLLFFAPYALSSVAWAENKIIIIPAGEAVIGADKSELSQQLSNSGAKPEWYMDETPKTLVKIKKFGIDSLEVTNTRYLKSAPKHTFPPNMAEHPVVDLTWSEAFGFCKKEGGRLPSPQEWEYAARGSKGSVYPWGDSFKENRAVYVKNSGRSGQKVGSFELHSSGEALLGGTLKVGSFEEGKSEFGLYDMAGNVWEWVDGWYDESKKLRLLKGGSWLTPIQSLRSSAKLGDKGERRYNDYGFRCAYDIK